MTENELEAAKAYRDIQQADKLLRNIFERHSDLPDGWFSKVNDILVDMRRIFYNRCNVELKKQ